MLHSLTPDEIAAAAQVLRARMRAVEAPENAIDVCGTGGDGSHSLNVSTAVAFVVARPGATLGEAELSKAMIAAVGKGMLPSRIHVVDSLPKTKNGKIMRRAIRARYLGEAIGDLSALDPTTPLESIPVRDGERS